MNDKQMLRLRRVGRRITRQLPEHFRLSIEFYRNAATPEVIRDFLDIHSYADIEWKEILRNPSQAALTHLVKGRLITALHNIQGYAEEQIRELEKVK